MKYDEFAKLPDRVKIEARLSRREWKMVDMLWVAHRPHVIASRSHSCLAH